MRPVKKAIKLIVDKLPNIIKQHIYYYLYCQFKANSFNKKTTKVFLNKSFYYEYFKIKKEIMPLPYYVQFEPTTRCNLSCVFCTHGTLAPENLKTDINIELVKHLIETNRNLLMIKLQGLGEPLMAKNFTDLVNFIKMRGIAMETFTNGTTLKNNKIHRNILIKHFTEVWISIDSINQENAEILRGGSNMKNILEGIKILVEERNFHKSRLKIKVNVVLSLLNYKEAKEIIERMNELGVDAIGLKELMNLTTSEDPEWLKNHIDSVTYIDKRKEVLSYLSEIKPENYKIEIYNLKQQYYLHNKGNCDWGFYWSFVTANGYTTPCCMRPEDKHKIALNPINQNFSELWNNEEYKYFRNSHMHNLPNHLCDYCPN